MISATDILQMSHGPLPSPAPNVVQRVFIMVPSFTCFIPIDPQWAEITLPLVFFFLLRTRFLDACLSPFQLLYSALRKCLLVSLEFGLFPFWQSKFCPFLSHGAGKNPPPGSSLVLEFLAFAFLALFLVLLSSCSRSFPSRFRNLKKFTEFFIMFLLAPSFLISASCPSHLLSYRAFFFRPMVEWSSDFYTTLFLQN